MEGFKQGNPGSEIEFEMFFLGAVRAEVGEKRILRLRGQFGGFGRIQKRNEGKLQRDRRME